MRPTPNGRTAKSLTFERESASLKPDLSQHSDSRTSVESGNYSERILLRELPNIWSFYNERLALSEYDFVVISPIFGEDTQGVGHVPVSMLFQE